MTTTHSHASGSPALDEQQVRGVLCQVIDPEVGMNIVGLGLVYRVDIAPGRLVIEMTMTSPACPMGDMIVEDVHAVLAKVLPATLEPEVRLVWEPPWDPSMMDEATKQHFGWTPQ